MPTTPRTLANRRNALLSTGPRTAAGKAVVAGNAVKTGLFARAPVVPSLGETAADFEAFRAAVAADLDPAGVVEAELADRVAGLMWRLRRVARHEAAAADRGVPLPPHPDEVTGDGVDLTAQLPPNAPTDRRLARARARLRQARGVADGVRAAAAVAGDLADLPAEHPVSPWDAEPVLAAAGSLLGWARSGGGDPWDAVTAGLGFENPRGRFGPWAAAQLRDALAAAAVKDGRGADGFPAAVAARVAEGLAEAEGAVAAREAEERDLAARLSAEREAAAAGGVLADPGLVERVARAEGHLSRELERAVALLDRLRARRSAGGGEGWSGVVVGVAAGEGGRNGFVLRDGRPGRAIPARETAPEFAGSDDRVGTDATADAHTSSAEGIPLRVGVGGPTRA